MSVRAGRYEDPSGGRRRYWNGMSWTARVDGGSSPDGQHGSGPVDSPRGWDGRVSAELGRQGSAVDDASISTISHPPGLGRTSCRALLLR